MVKILIGLLAAIVVAAAGVFGFQFYMQQRVAHEVDAAFEQIRTAGGKVSHGKVAFDLWSRTLTIADIAGESATQPPLTVKIAGVTATGVGQPEANRFSAATVEATDVEIGGVSYVVPDWRLSYKTPRIAIKDYSGPAGPLPRPVSASAADAYRLALEQFASVTASSVTVPSMVGTINTGATPGGSADFTYTGLAFSDIKAGKIAKATVERTVFATNLQPAGKPEKLTGDIAGITVSDLDTAAIIALLEAQPNDDRYYRVYRQLTAGSYSIKSDRGGPGMHLEGMTADEISLRPSRLQIPALMALLPRSGATPTPAQTRELLDKMAGIYEGVRIGNVELRGLAVETPQGPFKLAAMRFNLEDGKVGEFVFEGLDAGSPKGPVKVGRFALKSFDIANLLRMSSQFGTPGQQPTPDQLAGMFRLLAGAEVKGVVAPYKDTGAPVNIEAASLTWGQYVGPIPTMAHLTVKMSGPIEATDADPFKMLAAAGLRSAAMSVDVGAGWTETSRSFALDPVTFELGNVAAVSARLSLGNVPREVFSVNPQQAVVTAAQIEAGTLELTVHDLGGVDLAVAQYARTQSVGVDDARRAIVDNIKAGGTTPNGDANAAAIAGALAAFVETPRGTLTIRLTPKAKVLAMQLIQAMKTDPLAALAQFRVDASTAR